MANHPNIERLRIFITELENKISNWIIPDPDCCMWSTNLYNHCKTPGCHAGWVQIAIGSRYLMQQHGNYYYLVTAAHFSRWLLDDEHGDLELWAKLNPDIWGSKNYRMFCDGEAFNQPTDKFPATAILNHWKEVLKRLEALPNV